jgi:hypothetical protein
MHTLQTILVLKSLKVMRGFHKLKILQKKIRLNKIHFIRDLQHNGYAKIPDELKLSKMPLSYRFYDPVPKMIEMHAMPHKLHRLQPLQQ